MRPGWTTGSPVAPWPERSSTWLLLRMKNVPFRRTRQPRVPEQQMVRLGLVVRSVAFPPLVPKRMGSDWAAAVLLAYSTTTVAPPETAGSACDVAVMLTGSGLGIMIGE